MYGGKGPMEYSGHREHEEESEAGVAATQKAGQSSWGGAKGEPHLHDGKVLECLLLEDRSAKVSRKYCFQEFESGRKGSKGGGKRWVGLLSYFDISRP